MTQSFLFDVTKKIATECTDSIDLMVALGEIALNQARKFFFEESLQTAQSMPSCDKTDREYRHAIILLIIDMQAHQNPHSALAMAKSLDTDTMVGALHKIAVVQAHQKCKGALETAKLIPVKYIEKRDHCYREISVNLAHQKCFDLSKQAAVSISNPVEKSKAMKNIIELEDSFKSQQ